DDSPVHAPFLPHRARAKRVEARVDAEGSVRKSGEVADELRLRDFGQPGRTGTTKLFGHLRGGDLGLRQRGRAPARAGLFVNELHAASTSTRLSISAVVRFSVTATSSASSRPA